MNYEFNGKKPDDAKASFVAPSAQLIGEVILHQNSNIWFNAVLRADICKIEVGEGSNVQDNVVCHVDYDKPVIIGKNVTIGHNATLHGCRIGDGSLIGMGAVVLDGAEIGSESIVAAGSVVTPFTKIPSRCLVIGTPAQVKRSLNEDEIEAIKKNSTIYVELSGQYGKN